MAEVTVIRVFAAGTSADSAASVDIPEDGDIVSIHGLCTASGITVETEQATIELSFLSTNQITTNDARGSLMVLGLEAAADTAVGFAIPAISEVINTPDGIPVNAGERLHMHIRVSGSATLEGWFDIYFRTKSITRRTRRRR